MSSALEYDGKSLEEIEEEVVEDGLTRRNPFVRSTEPFTFQTAERRHCQACAQSFCYQEM